MKTTFDMSYASTFVSEQEIYQSIQQHRQALQRCMALQWGVEERQGWLHCERLAQEETVAEIIRVANEIRQSCEILVVVGIGGSNRAFDAAYRFFGARHRADSPQIILAGNNLSSRSYSELLEKLEGKEYVINVIAKDFNTLEPGVSFRLLREQLELKYGSAAAQHIVVTGSEGSGQLRKLAEQHDYRFLPFNEDVGGRFTAMTPVGLLPMAVAGIDIRAILRGATRVQSELLHTPLEQNVAVRYALVRNLLFAKGFHIESMAVAESSLEGFARWWLQVFGESEGKAQNAIFPTYFCYSEDLHAMGQYVQEGRRFIFETFLEIFDEQQVLIPTSPVVQDGFDYLNGMTLDHVNRAMLQAALQAHSDDNIPCLRFCCEEFGEEQLGELYYFFMFACYLSTAIINVNPFDQNGVDGYKLNMYRILDKI